MDLTSAVLDAIDRAMRVSLAADLCHEFVDVVLPLVPEAAPEFHRIVVHDQMYNEGYLLRTHAPLLWQRDRDFFYQRLATGSQLARPLESLAAVVRAVPTPERDEVRTRAAPFWETELFPLDRARALLAWTPFEPSARAQSMRDEAVAIAQSLGASCLYAICAMYGDGLGAGGREAVRAIAEAGEPEHAKSAYVALLRWADSPDEAAADAERALRHAAKSESARDLEIAAYGLLGAVPFTLIRPHLEPRLRMLDTRRALLYAAQRLAPHAPPDVLAILVERTDALVDEAWARAAIFAIVEAAHPGHHAGLLTRAREDLERVVGDPLTGDRMSDADVPYGADRDDLRITAVAYAGAAFAGDERRSFQRRALDLLASRPSDHAARHALQSLPWHEFGLSLDPALRERAVQTAVAIRHRATALKSLGTLVSGFPPDARHFALAGLSRLADAAPVDAAARVSSLLRTPVPAAPALARAGATGRSENRWAHADAVSLAPFEARLAAGGYLLPSEIEPLAAPLTRAAAHRAAPLVRTLADSLHRLTATLALALAPALAGDPLRGDLVAEALDLVALEHAAPETRAKSIGAAVNAASSDDPDAWRTRLAAFFNADTSDLDILLALLAEIAPSLRLLGGAALAERVGARLAEPMPMPEFARPWALAAHGDFGA